MVRSSIVAAVCVLFVWGCYDLSFADDSHTVTDFQILAIRVDPPELRPDTPLSADVLFADPMGGSPIHAAWSVRLYDREADVERQAAVTIGPDESLPTAGTGIDLPSPQFRLAEKTADPVLLFEVYLCHGGFRDPGRVGFAATSELLDTLCTEGKAVSGIKYISPARASSLQNNPRIARVTFNGQDVLALEDGGKTIRLCESPSECDSSVAIEAYLDTASIDMISPEGLRADDGDRGGPDAGEAADAGLQGEFPEYHRVDWYVTGGSLTNASSRPPTDAVDAASRSFDFKTTWNLPKAPSAPLTLFVIARDIRGGNDWRSFQVQWGGK